MADVFTYRGWSKVPLFCPKLPLFCWKLVHLLLGFWGEQTDQICPYEEF